MMRQDDRTRWLRQLEVIANVNPLLRGDLPIGIVTIMLVELFFDFSLLVYNRWRSLP
jgi:hypothetical protein